MSTTYYNENYYNEVKSKYWDKLADACDTKKYGKEESYAKIKELKKEGKEAIPEDDEAGRKKFGKYYDVLRER